MFHGKSGELRQRYREGQEDQLGSLGLVVNVIVLWNTIYMHAALNQLRAEGFDVRPKNVAGLSPLGFDHINMLGRYAFILPTQSPAESFDRSAIPPSWTTRAEMQFRFRCFCNGPLVVKLKVHPIAGFVLLSVVGARPPLHAVRGSGGAIYRA